MGGRHHVSEHVRSDGTRVAAHTRSSQGKSAGQQAAGGAVAKAKAAAAAAAESAEADRRWHRATCTNDHEVVQGALPADRTAPSAHLAALWRERAFESEFVTGVMKAPDGRHVVCVAAPRSPGASSPRDDRNDPLVSIGTVAVTAPGLSDMGDEDLSGGRADWWSVRRGEPDSVQWMMRQMFDPDNSGPVSDADPTWDDMNAAALAYHERTGDFAFPLSLDHHEWKQMVVHKPEAGAKQRIDEGIGFMFVSKEEAAAQLADDDLDELYEGRVRYAIAVLNSHMAGKPTQITAAFFEDEQTSDEPTQIRRSEHYSHAQIAEEFYDCVDSMRMFEADRD